MDPITDKLDGKTDVNDHGPGPTKIKMADSNTNKYDGEERDLENSPKELHRALINPGEEPHELTQEKEDQLVSEDETMDDDSTTIETEQDHTVEHQNDDPSNQTPTPGTTNEITTINDEDTTLSQRTLRNRDRELDYKALSTGRDSKEKKKTKKENNIKQDTHKGTTRTEKGRRGLHDQGLGERAPTLVNEENVGQGERAPTDTGLGERAPTRRNTGSGKGKSTGKQTGQKKRPNKEHQNEGAPTTSAARTDINERDTQKDDTEDDTTQGDTETEIEIHPDERSRKKEKKKRGSSTENSSESESSSSSSSSSSESSSDSETTPKRRTKRKSNKKMKRRMKKFKAINRELEKENLRLQEKIEEKRNSIRRKEDEIARQKRKNEETTRRAQRTQEKIDEETTRRAQRMQEKIDELGREMERSKEENARLREKVKKAEYVKEEFKQQRAEAAKRYEKADKELKESRKKIEECEELNKELLHKLTNARTVSQHKRTPSRSNLRLIFIGDSNSRRIAPHLDRRNRWDYSQDTYVIKDLERIKCDTMYDGAVFLLGTNDIKKGNDGRKEAETLMNYVRNFKQAKNLFILELPPINRRGIEVERRVFNSTLHSQNKDNRFQIIRMTREIEHAPVESALQDDLHLTKENAKQMATHLENVIEKHIEGKTQDPGKATREEAEQEYEGTRQRNERAREERRNIPCKFHIQGRCHKGNRCFFAHDEPSTSENRGRARSSERRPSDYNRRARSTERRPSDYNRSRSPSGDRRRVVLSDRTIIRQVEHE